jgi:hypothetical protein
LSATRFRSIDSLEDVLEQRAAVLSTGARRSSQAGHAVLASRSNGVIVNYGRHEAQQIST